MNNSGREKNLKNTIAIIDYGIGNIRSVENAFLKLHGHSASIIVTNQPEVITKADKIVLPGVGAFGDCMRNLEQYGVIKPIREAVYKGTPFLGICVGLQVLFEGSEENPGVAGLGFFKGIVKKIKTDGLKIPHIGWNSLSINRSRSNLLFEGILQESYVYFVHSFYPSPEDSGIIAASSDYGGQITAAVSHENIHGVQFHPEKSGDIGLKILANFSDF